MIKRYDTETGAWLGMMADPALVDMLRKALDGREEMEIRWARS